jgi:hypothetical protein
LNILSGSAKNEIEPLLRKHGCQILGKNQRELVMTVVDGRETMGELIADYTVQKNGQRLVVVIGEGDPAEPALRGKLIEYDRTFGLNGVIFVDQKAGKIEKVVFKFPRERGLDFYFQFFTAIFILAAVIGIIWLLVAVKLF